MNPELLESLDLGFDPAYAHVTGCWDQVVAGTNYWFKLVNVNEGNIMEADHGSWNNKMIEIEIRHILIFEPLPYTMMLPYAVCQNNATFFDDFTCDQN